ncbi:response regulator [Alteromonas sp. Cnat2-8]|uniref:response regulator n=1 Tax=Alteromonas sp. Cnat2-8 TaxID=2917728 RepID=UPI001EF6464E|nr:response regulator [Alteromonas sp. Cnat2-8]MCG7653107.1 response regulator [Alteromonas sp. Cnat2-8]
MSAIHLVDDSATMLMSMEMLLKRAGYTVTKSESAEAAMTALESINPKLIITDLNMPGMNGIELIKTLKQQSKFRFTPMLMLTTESQQSRREEAKAAGATGWLVKPVEPEQLLGVVKQLVPTA